MNKTIALFITVMIILVISCVFGYVTIPKNVLPKEENIVIEAVENEVKEPPKKVYEQQSYLFKYPKYGMQEKYIGRTSLGEPDIVEVLDGSNGRTKTYVWLNGDGTHHAYAITQIDYSSYERIVVYYYNYGNGTSAYAPKKTYYSSDKGSNKSDPYNAKDYGYADDFYDEYYDDFYDYEDAEGYWMEHRFD